MKSALRQTVTLAVVVAAAGLAYSQSATTTSVRTIEKLVLHDATRKKDIPLKIYYPVGAGPFPVIVFSHGAWASKDSYSALGQYWAAHGYVSIHPSHADSRKDSDTRGTLPDTISDPQAWEDRPKDISFVLDSLGLIEKKKRALRGKLDRTRIGVGGHSFGAYTAEAVAGATVTMPGKTHPQSFADKRVRAFVVMSPQGTGEMGLTDHSWDHIRVPMFLMYGTRDFGTQRRTPTWRSQPFYYSPPGDKYDLVLDGATHLTFVGPIQEGAPVTPLFECVEIASQAFWDAYLKDDVKAKQLLSKVGIQKSCGGAANLRAK
jgi:predicted dienelactone hydrolase